MRDDTFARAALDVEMEISAIEDAQGARARVRPILRRRHRGIFSSEMPTPLSAISMDKRPSRLQCATGVLPPRVGAQPCFKEFSTIGWSSMLGTSVKGFLAELLHYFEIVAPNRATSYPK